MTNLSDTDSHRRIVASEVRTQAIAISVRRRRGYPRPFGNHEELPLYNHHPLIEHPLTPTGSYVAGSPPGPARIIVNRYDRSTPEAIYHDPTVALRPESREHPFSKAEYRGKDRMVLTGLEEELWEMDIEIEMEME